MIEWIKAALDRGRGTQFAYALTQVPPGYATYTGVDLGKRPRQRAVCPLPIDGRNAGSGT